MRHLYVLVLTLVLACKGSDPAPADTSVSATSLVGKWEYMEAYTNPNWHSIYEFKSDGTLLVTGPGSPNYYTYRVENGVLRVVYQYGPIQKDRECTNYVLPSTFGNTLVCRALGSGYCTYVPTGKETTTQFTLVRQ
ncbi:hypothetical protein FAES_3292 [Fibrella aestuarina BUZ 2]|uniref:Lipocalin-like domain-containing protein n=1 Tax=Fibrella aestuarina BUZ 2 TaxID=1166018 RepID=I0KAZ7_9BACT|nr:hypothetical protein [Fibrella aestuarina]CCH01300.1 hypothetical protein FAES_3292 [Fibrella aestuarina BUZ 2]